MAVDEKKAKPRRSRAEGKLSSKEAIRQVLASGEPMKSAAIAEAAVPLTDLQGATPAATIAAVLSVEAKKENGLVERVEKGTFKLRAEAEPV